MEEEDKEKIISEIRLREIEAIDRDTTSLANKLFFGLFAITAFLYIQGILSRFPQLWILIIIMFLQIILMQNQCGRYIFDLYNGLARNIKTNRIGEFKPHMMGWFEGIWYKKRY